jgi:hypothetical protein
MFEELQVGLETMGASESIHQPSPTWTASHHSGTSREVVKPHRLHNFSCIPFYPFPALRIIHWYIKTYV